LGVINVGLVCSDAIARRAYGLLLERLCCRLASTSDFTFGSLALALRKWIDVIVMPITVVGSDLRVALHAIRRLRANVPALLVVAERDSSSVFRLIGGTTVSLVLQEDGLAELENALAVTAAQRQYFSRASEAALLKHLELHWADPQLSARETELLPLLANGLTLEAAAAAMGVAYKTAESQRTALLRKLGLRNRVELTRYAIRQGLIVP